MAVSLYDPLTYDNLMQGLVLHFEKQPKISLSEERASQVPPGPGIYALFYYGEFGLYAPIVKADQAIYVGKAVPPGRRKGDVLDVDYPALRSRIMEHVKSVEHAVNLDVADFAFRALPTLPVWISTAEEALIKHYSPVWNRCLDGFGNHDPGKGRVGGKRSWWDTLHPGRKWAERLRAVKTEDEAVKQIERFFSADAKP